MFINKVLLLVFTGLLLGGCGSSNALNNNVENTPSVTVQNNAKYKMEEVAKHGTKGDCWMAISGKVYDLSKHPEHPGGNIIFESCGKDAMEAFNTKGGIGKVHSEIAKALLSKFYIGDLE